MKVRAIQWLWLIAVVLFAVSLLLDLANILNVPPIYMLLCSTLLIVSGWWLMPSVKEMSEAHRRRP